MNCLCKLQNDGSLKTFSKMLYGENRCLWYLTNDHRAGLTEHFCFCLNLSVRSVCVFFFNLDKIWGGNCVKGRDNVQEVQCVKYDGASAFLVTEVLGALLASGTGLL